MYIIKLLILINDIIGWMLNRNKTLNREQGGEFVNKDLLVREIANQVTLPDLKGCGTFYKGSLIRKYNIGAYNSGA